MLGVRQFAWLGQSLLHGVKLTMNLRSESRDFFAQLPDLAGTRIRRRVNFALQYCARQYCARLCRS